jgi:multidrug efflux pump subunit AcrA (membrane-fusion protein)
MAEENPRTIDPEKRANKYLDLTPDQIEVELERRAELSRAAKIAAGAQTRAYLAAVAAYKAALATAKTAHDEAYEAAFVTYQATSPMAQRATEVFGPIRRQLGGWVRSHDHVL